MMAYRSTEHEKTGITPNILMLGRETTTPLDICFEMPPSIKSEITNEWVWELREKLETAHTFVRQNTGHSIRKQKFYHDRKSNNKSLNVNDNVYVLFPVKRAGQTAKFCSFWRGPFKIMERLCDVLYVIDCGRNGIHQVIHIDRLKKAKPQTLINEPEDNDITDTMPDVTVLQTESVSTPNIVEQEEEIAEQENYSRFGRQRRKPIWLQDFVSSIFSKEMPNLKTTPRKRDICPVCKLTIEGESFGDHMDRCVKERHQCVFCGILCSKPQNLRQHIRRKHSEIDDQSEKDIKCQKIAKKDTTRGPEKPSIWKKNDLTKQHKVQPSQEKSDPPAHKRSWAFSKDLSLSSSEEKSDWNVSPKIQVNEGHPTEDCSSEARDERRVRDLQLGRVIRKPFVPTLVMATIRHKKVEETVTSGMLEKELRAEKCELIVTGEETERKNDRPVVSTRERAETDSELLAIDREPREVVNASENSGNLKLKFGVTGNAGDKLMQSFMLQQNGDILMDSKVSRAPGTGMGDMEINVGDLTRSTIKPENIKVNVIKGEFCLDIKY